MIADDASCLRKEAVLRLVEAIGNLRRHPRFPKERIKTEDFFIPIIVLRAVYALSERDRRRTQPAAEIDNRTFSSEVARCALAKESHFS
jgi:hypothetical protein